MSFLPFSAIAPAQLPRASACVVVRALEAGVGTLRSAHCARFNCCLLSYKLGAMLQQYFAEVPVLHRLCRLLKSTRGQAEDCPVPALPAGFHHVHLAHLGGCLSTSSDYSYKHSCQKDMQYTVRRRCPG